MKNILSKVRLSIRMMETKALNHFKESIAAILCIVLACSWLSFMVGDNVVYKQKVAERSNHATTMKMGDVLNKNMLYAVRSTVLKIQKDSVERDLEDAKVEIYHLRRRLSEYDLMAHLEKKDTIQFSDTIFRDPYLHIDTVLRTEWYAVNMGLRYPGNVIVSPVFKDSLVIDDLSVSTEKVSKKNIFFLFRPFVKTKKTHRVSFSVCNENPFVDKAFSEYSIVVTDNKVR